MLKLGQLKNSKGATKQRKRLGRGPGSGQGQQAGKGHKGQTARTGGGIRLGFEGGQMPLYRRLPKRGFTNLFRKNFAVVNLSEIAKSGLKEVTLESLKQSGVLKTKHSLLKVLGSGELKGAVQVKAHAISESAKAKIEKAGGKVEILA